MFLVLISTTVIINGGTKPKVCVPSKINKTEKSEKGPFPDYVFFTSWLYQ